MRLVTTMATVLAAAAVAFAAQAQPKVKGIWTGGQKGAYHSTFCPPLEPALRNAQFTGYTCTACETGKPCGSVANIERVMANPASIGFAQLDVYARTTQEKPEVAERTQVIKQLACEGIWMVTKNPRITNFGDVLGLARRLPFKVASGGSEATFKFVQSIDPDGLGRARNVDVVQDATAAINAAIGDPNAVGMFVQFADPENANIKLMLEKGLTVIPVASRELSRAKAGGVDVYQVQEFALASGYWSGKSVTTSCTPVVIITGKPTAFKDKADADDQTDLIKEVDKLPAEKLMPQEGRIASLLKQAKRVGGKTLDELHGAVEAAKKRVMESQQ